MGQTSVWNKFLLLLWKNFVLRKRHKIQTLFEVFLPVVFAAILVIVRTLFDYTHHYEPTYFDSFTADYIPFTTSRSQWKLGWTPNVTAVHTVMQSVAADLNVEIEGHGYATESEMVSDINSGSTAIQSNSFLGGIAFTNSFDDNGSFPSGIAYKIRLPGVPRQSAYESAAYSWHTDVLYPMFMPQGPRDADYPEGLVPGYYQEGFLALQFRIDLGIIKVLAPNATASIAEHISMQRYPYPPYLSDTYLEMLQSWLPLIIMLSFIYTVVNIVRSVVHEKERMLKESLKIMGMSGWLHWCAWFVKYLAFLTVSCIFMTLFVCMHCFPDSSLAVLSNSNFIIVFLYFFLNSIALICFSFMVSTFFSTSSSGAVGGGVLYFISFVPFFFLQTEYQSLSLGTKYGTSLLSNTAVAYGGIYFTQYETLGVGSQWSNLFSNADPDDGFTLGAVYLMLILDSVLYMLIALYIEAVFPGEFGVPKPWYFLFTKSFYCGLSGNVTGVSDHPNLFPHLIEEDPTGQKCGIQINGLTKVYGKNVAVSNLHLNMYEDQITVLLGHNGAGKTTTMSMLTGMFPSSGGTAVIDGYDISKETAKARGSLGLCPQHDVLFDDLTVAEHIEFFSRLKGLPRSAVKDEIDNIIRSMDIVDKRDTLSSKLSGGMKRKLSVGIALCANSRVVLLDEPSSGMDPGARRFIWDLLLKEKRGRTILLTTHFMEEADVLGDRIAIMATGQLQCCGSPLFLKKHLGAGYRLVLVKGPTCQAANVTPVLKRHVPEVAVQQEVASELTYLLPEDKSHLFAEMFRDLEGKKDSLDIDSYGASITTMEEVFLRVSEDADRRREITLNESDNFHKLFEAYNAYSTKPTSTRIPLNSGFKLFIQQWRAMILKKGIYTLRTWLLTLILILIPAVMLIICLVVFNTMSTITVTGEPDALTISLGSYTQPETIVQNISDENPIYESYLQYSQKSSTVSVVADLEAYILERSASSMINVAYHDLIGLAFDERNITAWFNDQPYHTPPLTLTAIDNAVLTAATQDSSYSITTVNHPLPYDANTELDQSTSSTSMGFQIGFNINFGFSFVAAGFLLFVVKERVSNSKHLQFVSGVSMFPYWLSVAIFDFFMVLLSGVLVIVVLVCFQQTEYVSGTNLGVVFLVFVGFAMCVTPLMYLFSFGFEVPASGYAKICLFNLLTGLVTTIITMIINMTNPDIVSTLNWIFMLFPNYNVGMAMSQMYSNYHYVEYCSTDELIRLCRFAPRYPNMSFPCCKEYGNCGSSTCYEWSTNYLAWEPMGIGRNIFMMFVEAVVLWIILFTYEAKFLQWLQRTVLRRSSSAEDRFFELDSMPDVLDSDVATERRRILQSSLTALSRTDNLIIMNLEKKYGDLVAVKGITLGVQKGECFGLLGINGAGKTTTFKMLTGDLPITRGQAYINGYSISKQLKKVQENIGYCPQFDAVLLELTGLETLYMFGRLRGASEDDLDGHIRKLVDELLLAPHIHKRVGAYSGGNKRKLSVAIALLGDPPIVFLDEPTTGMDPVARRHLWTVLDKVRAGGQSIVFTSHSMEECEALCTRIAIMVDGQFKCLGSPQHLKSRFAEGYTLEAKVARGEENVSRLRNFIENTFQGCVLKDVHQGTINYQINNTSIAWSTLFEVMEQAKEKFNIDAYSVGETTLEQVFLSFSKYSSKET